MAIAGLLVHVEAEYLVKVEARLRQFPELTSYGAHGGKFIVVVAETTSQELEPLVDRVGELDGVLTVYTSYLTVEDEVLSDKV